MTADDTGWVIEGAPDDDPNGILVRYQDAPELAAHRAGKCHVTVICHSALKRRTRWTLAVKYRAAGDQHYRRAVCNYCGGRAWWYLDEGDDDG